MFRRRSRSWHVFSCNSIIMAYGSRKSYGIYISRPLSASKLLTAIDDSMKFSDDENNSDNDNDDFRAFTTTNENNEKESD